VAHAARFLCVLAAATAAGCGSSGDDPTALRHWPAATPSFAPPDPAAYARMPSATGGDTDEAVAPADADAGAPSDAEVARDLREALGAAGDASAEELVDAASLTPAGLATVPPSAPARVAAVIRGANEVAHKPYVYGGGHGRLAEETWIDTAYDCSGSISFALATAGYLDAPMDSTRLARFGRPGPGRWVTIYANAGHAFMTVAGLRFDTSGRQRTGTRWQAEPRGAAGFTVRHPPGL
jgi:hypothetical protein